MVFVTWEAGIGKTMFIDTCLQHLTSSVQGQEELQKIKIADSRPLTFDSQAGAEAYFLKAFAIPVNKV